MDYRRFNIHLKEAGGLDRTKLLFKRRVYATVSIVGSSPTKQRTSEATYSGNNPTWGSSSSMRFYVEDTKLQHNCLVLMVQILRKRVFRSDKVIGEVCVPLKELYDYSGGVSSTNHSFHQVVKPFGANTRRLGYLYFTYEFGGVIRARERNNDNGAIAAAATYPLMRSHSRVIPSAPCLENLMHVVSLH